jgi:hypothetical protein
MSRMLRRIGGLIVWSFDVGQSVVDTQLEKCPLTTKVDPKVRN